MAAFIELTHRSGEPVTVNADNILTITDQKTKTAIEFTGRLSPLFVAEKPRQIVAKLEDK